MRVPLTVRDFLDRAELVYGDRIGIIDEPDQGLDPHETSERQRASRANGAGIAGAPASERAGGPRGEAPGVPNDGWGRVTYRELARRARAFGAALDRFGVGPGERVAIVSHNSARFIAALYGATTAGRILVPINFRLHAHEVRYIVEHSGARVLLIDSELDAHLQDLAVDHRFVLGRDSDRDLFLSGEAPGDTMVAIDEDDVATLNYTSGTTARPKGVMLTHRNLWMNATTFGWHAGINDRDRFLQVVPLFHCNGWGMPFSLAAMGGTQVMLRRAGAAEILRRVAEHSITLLGGAPAVVNAILDCAREWDSVPGRGTVRMLVAGAPPSTTTIARVERELGWELIHLYGLTETSPLITINRLCPEYDALTPEARAAKLARAGAPVIGSAVKVDAHGEVLARANVVMKGYWQDEAATAAAIRDGWLHTGDGGVQDDEGYIVIADRKKDVIITGGENVSSIEVEDCLAAHAAVAEVAVIGVPDNKWGETVKALVVLRAQATATERELIDHCRSRLAHYKCPTSVELRGELARTATGKLQKFLLRAPYWAGRGRQVN